MSFVLIDTFHWAFRIRTTKIWCQIWIDLLNFFFWPRVHILAERTNLLSIKPLMFSTKWKETKSRIPYSRRLDIAAKALQLIKSLNYFSYCESSLNFFLFTNSKLIQMTQFTIFLGHQVFLTSNWGHEFRHFLSIFKHKIYSNSQPLSSA